AALPAFGTPIAVPMPPVVTASAFPAPSFVTPAGYAAPVAPAAPVQTASDLPVGRWVRTLNDQSVTITIEADGSFTALCTVPDSGCCLEATGDCRATEDGLLFGVVTSAKACPGENKNAVACMQIEAFCRTLIDQPFSARCRVTNDTLTVSNALFGGIGFVGTPGPGEPAHLALTMFSGAYEAK
ncbi:MAG: hypothetical protein AAF907_14975, partial [Planctomycetota bacterium]